MRILFSAGSFGRGGKEVRMIALMEYLARQGAELALIANPDSPHLPKVAGFCKQLYRFRAGKPAFNLREHRRAVGEFQPDLIHSWNGSCTTWSILGSLGAKCPVVTSEITNARPLKIWSAAFLMTRFNFAFSSLVFSNSRAGLAAKKAPRRKSHVIYNGYSFERLAVRKEGVADELAGSDGLKVLMAARFCREKDYDTVIRAAALAQQAGLATRFFLAGEGPDFSRIQAEAERMNLQNIRFLGHVENVDSVLPHMDVGLLATDPRFHQEGISNSVMEYMAHGKPAIVTDGPAVGEIIHNGCNGFITTPRNPQQILGRLAQLESRRELIDELGREAQKTIREKFNLKDMGAAFVRAYEKLALSGADPVAQVEAERSSA
jgi:glycosyltransferase involved in cell wall biosynthesis